MEDIHSGTASASPSATAATRIAAIMSSLLRVRRIEPASDFFGLGGNSLLCAQLVFQLQREYRVDLSVKDVFEAKTLQRMTELVCARLSDTDVAIDPPAREAARRSAPVGASTTDPVPVTAQQRSIWLLEHSAAGKGVSNVAIVLSYRGAIDGARLESSLRETVRRHAALRTIYDKQGASVLQRVKPYVAIGRRWFDLGALQHHEQGAALAEIKAEEIARPFDLSRDAMVRLTQVQLAADAGVLLFLFHHIAVDDRSLDIFFADLQAFYAAPDGAALAPPERSFLDYCRDDAEAEAGGDRAAMRDFWRDQLQGMQGTAYPSRGGAAATGGFSGRHHYHVIPADLTAALDAAAARRSTTPFCIFAAAVTYLLYRATGSDDVSIAALMSRRDRFTDHDVIGCFVNTVPLRTRLRPDWSLDQLIAAVQAGFVDAYAHRHVAFEDMLEAAALPDGPRVLPVTVNMEAENREEFRLGDVQLCREPLDRGIAKRDLALSLRKAGCYRILVEYRSDRYGADEVALLAENLQAALARLVAEPGARLGAGLLAPAAAMPDLFAALGWSRRPDAEPKNLASLIRQAAVGGGDKPAVIGPGHQLSYRQLDDGSDRVAGALSARGVRPGDLVAVTAPRQPETIAALLGIWKAGAGYLVIDDALPLNAQQRIVAACRPVLLLNGRAAASPLGLPVLALEAALAAPQADRAVPLRADAVAYVSLTSGSTGLPKAVAVRHRSITRIVRGASYASISADDGFLGISPLGFDGSVFEIWAPLCNGATLRLLGDGAFSLDQVAAALDCAKVSILFVTTQLFNALVDSKLGALLGLRTILFGGEKASRDHVARLVAAGFAGELRNIYGPTETAVFATSHRVDAASLLRFAGAIPIGRAHNDTSIAILNDRLEPVPCGVVGEIAIGGPGVADGYVNDADLTAAKFVDLQLPGNPDHRFYRSGDLGVIDRRGEIEFVGRRDRQIKLNGHRIELDAIEAVIAAAPGVSGCHCELDDGLLAYVGHDPARGSAEAIKAHVRAELPAYQCPAEFVFAAQLPLNPNGKIDVGALRALRRPDGAAAAAAAPAAPDLVAMVREVWRQELKSDAFGDDDNFFDVGGTSLKIMLAHDELSKRLAALGLTRELEITHLFEYTTVAALGGFLEDYMHAP